MTTPRNIHAPFSSVTFQALGYIQALARLGPQVGDVFFVDATNGSDTADGKTPATALKTIGAALAKCTDAHNDVIVAWGNFAEVNTIEIEKLHIYGLMTGGQSYLTRINSVAEAETATFLIHAYDVEIAYLQVLGNHDVGVLKPAIYAEGDEGGSRSHIHDALISALTPSATKYCNGIDLEGDRHTVERVIIENCKNGIKVLNGYTAAAYKILLKDLRIRACDTGIDVNSLTEGTGKHGLMGENIDIDAYGAYAEDRGIKVEALGGHPVFRNCFISGYTTAITKGNAKWVNCYEDTGGGTLINPANY